MIKRIIVDISENKTRIALLEDLVLTEIYIDNESNQTLVGNIYIGRITNILPGIESAFVDIGLDINAFMYTGVKKELYDIKNQQQKLKIGTELPVQVIKDATANKGPVVSRYISMSGRLIALMPNQDYVGISRKITDAKEKERLNNIALSNKPVGYGLILRTNSQNATEEEIITEINLLKDKTNKIMDNSDFIKAPFFLYKELSSTEKAIRDLFSNDIDEFIINDEETFTKVKAKLINSPKLINKVKLYSDEINIFDKFWINSQLNKALEKKVWLKSGGYIVIEQTEACVVIDVNSGKNTCKKNIAQAILKNNEEAAVEIAKQIRLRNLSGIIIIDFISMKDDNDKKIIQGILENEVKKDRIKTVVVGMTELGLMQLTRKKTRESLEKQIIKNNVDVH